MDVYERIRERAEPLECAANHPAVEMKFKREVQRKTRHGTKRGVEYVCPTCKREVRCRLLKDRGLQIDDIREGTFSAG